MCQVLAFRYSSLLFVRHVGARFGSVRTSWLTLWARNAHTLFTLRL